MALPDKKRGFRKIAIGGRNFNWKLAVIVDIRPELHKENRVTVDFGWFDEFLFLSDKINRPPDFEPKVVTSKFVKQAIEFALEHKWDPEKKSGLMQLKFSDGQFGVLAS